MAKRHLTEHQQRRMKEAQLARCRNPHLADVVERNIGTIIALREEHERQKSLQDRISDVITQFSGSMAFLFLHVLWFFLWITINMGAVPGIAPFDPYPF